VPGIFLGGKGLRSVGLKKLTLHVPIVLKSGNLNFQEPSEPVQVRNGIALPLLLQRQKEIILFFIRVCSPGTRKQAALLQYLS
jgi:hypothetical protein